MTFSMGRLAAAVSMLVAAGAILLTSAAASAQQPPPPPSLPQSPAPAPPQPQPKYDLIASTALKYLGRVEGQCWPFMQRVVFEATGKVVGFDYRLGFFEAGAAEVDLKQARSGDVVQIARDDNTSPAADYLGLHTAIVLQNHGDGSFTVVSSNDQWDGVVRIRENYRPADQAARYTGLSFHIYRIPYQGNPVPPPLEPRQAVNLVTPKGPLKVGDAAVVRADGDCLNLREEASTSARALTCLRDGDDLRVLSDPIAAGGRIWVKVSSGGLEGYVAVEYIAHKPVSVPEGNTTASANSPANGGSSVKPAFPFRAYVPLLVSSQ